MGAANLPRPVLGVLLVVAALLLAGGLVLAWMFSGLGGPLHGAGRRGGDAGVALSMAFLLGLVPALLVSIAHARGPTASAQGIALGFAILFPIVHPLAVLGLEAAADAVLGKAAQLLREPAVTWALLLTEVIVAVVVSSAAWRNASTDE